MPIPKQTNNLSERQNYKVIHSQLEFPLQKDDDFPSGFAHQSIESAVELITPKTAEEYLKTQKVNRVPTSSRVRDYADRMKRGEWHISQPIQFTSEGDLFDGQHRLLAVIRSKTPCYFLVVRGLPPETRCYVDIGQTRRIAQVARIMGLDSSCLEAKLATCKTMFIGAGLNPKNKRASIEAKNIVPAGGHALVLSPQKRIDLYVEHQESIDFANQLTTPATAPVRAVVARAWYHENHIRLQQFVTVLNTGYPITEFDEAAIALRNVLLLMKKEAKDVNKRVSLYKKTLSAVSHFLSNRNVRYIKEKDVELYPIADFD